MHPPDERRRRPAGRQRQALDRADQASIKPDASAAESQPDGTCPLCLLIDAERVVLREFCEWARHAVDPIELALLFDQAESVGVVLDRLGEHEAVAS